MINPLSNPSYLLSPLIATSIIIGLLVLVWKRGRRDFSSRIFSGLLLSLGLWSLLTFGMRSSPDIYHALPWEKALIVAGVTAFVLYHHLTLTYANIRWGKWIIPAIYSFLAAFAVIVATTDLAIKGMSLEHYGYAPILGPISFLIFIPVPLLVAGGAYNLIKSYRASFSSEKRNQLLYLASAALFPLLGASLDAFSDLPPASIWSNLIFCIICSIAVLKYHLLDIRVVIRKSLVYLVLSATVAIPYVGALFLLHRVLDPTIDIWWVHALVILSLAIVLRPLYSRAQGWVDKAFYRDRYDNLKALERFSQEAQSIVNIDELGSTMTRLVSGALRTSSTCLLLASEAGGDFRLASSTGLDTPPSGIVLRTSSPLVKWLTIHQDILSSKELGIVPQLQSLSLRERNMLRRIGAEAYVPIKTRQGQLSGILVLGQKISQQLYSYEDKELLRAVSSHIAMALENAQLYRNATQRQQDLEAWLNSMSDCVMIIDTDHVVQFANKAVAERLGGKTGGMCWEVLGRDAQCPDCPVEQLLRNNEEGSVYSTNVRHRQYEAAVGPLLNPDGSLSIIEVLRDITERKKAEEKLKASLEEKEVLLKEIHHRVKNNLQVISSLLRLQSGYIEDERDAEMFKESQERVRSMALVHERLYQSKDLARIDCGEYIKDLRRELLRSHGSEGARMAIKAEVEEIRLGVDQAIPCGLIINELVSNSLKHAFPEGEGGEIRIAMRQVGGDEVELEVSDNGAGIPESMEIRNAGSLGLRLVSILAEDQLRGEMELDRTEGTRFRIRFRVS